MNKGELIKELAYKTGLTQKDSGKFLDALAETIGEAVSQGEKVSILGFGTFELRERTAYKGVAFGQEVDIPASKSVGFRAGKSLKEAVQ